MTNKQYSYDDIVKILESYAGLEVILKQLAFELEHMIYENQDDLLTDKVFKTPNGERVFSSRVSDKTATIAISYSAEAQDINKQIIQKRDHLQSEFENIKIQMERIKYYILLLEEKPSKILYYLYIDRLKWAEVLERVELSEKTVIRHKKEGISKIMEMFNRINSA